MPLNLGISADETGGADKPIDGIAPGGDPGGNEQPAKRPRGRPVGSGKSKPAVDTVEPGSLGGNNSGDPGADAGAERKRGRTRKEKEAPISVEAFIFVLGVTQLSLVEATSIPEFNIGDKQTAQLAGACANVARHYPVVMTQKQQDIGTLIFSLGAIGYTQFRAYQIRVAFEAAQKKKAEEASTVDVNFSRVQ